MNISQEEIFDLLHQLAIHENIRVCIKQSSLNAMLTGLFSFFGGLTSFEGRSGLVEKGSSTDDYVSVIHVIKNEMNAAQRRQLLQSAKNILTPISGPVTLPTILNKEEISSNLSNLIKSSVKDMGYTIK